MDIVRVFMSLRPGATFVENQFNPHSLETIAATFEGTVPTQAEMDAEWARLQAEDVVAASNASLLEQIAATEGDDRLAEDLIDLLVAKGVFTEDELPQKAKDKIDARRTLRGQLQ